MAGNKKRPIITFNSPVVLGFVIACFAVTLTGIISGGRITRALFMTYRSSLMNPLTYLRFFTYVLGHSGWSHFVGNACYLLLLGPMLEEKYGARMLIQIIAITAFATAILNYIFFPSVALCGASGIVFAFIILASFTGFKDGEIPLTFILVAVIYIGQQVIEGITVKDDVSNMAHIMGSVVGAILGYMLNVRRKS